MKRIRQYGRIAVCIAVLALVGLVGIGSTYAWNTHEAKQENHLQSKNASVNTVESFPDPTVTPGTKKTKQVSFQNTGTASVFLRVAYTESWETADALLAGSTDVTKQWTASWKNDWELKDDGWYYYKRVLPAGASTGRILESVTFPQTVPNGASYSLSFLTEVVQVSDEDAVNTAATGAVFGRTAVVTGKKISNGTVTTGTVTWN